MKKALFAVFLGGLILLGLGCSKSSSKVSDTPLRLVLKAEPSNLNSILHTDVPSAEVIGLISNGLFRLNSNLELEPDLLESYTVSDDGKTFVFHLKKNAKWSDGHPITAEDVVFTFDTLMSPKTNTVRRGLFVIEGKPVKFKALDTYTVQATLPEPFAPFLTNMSMGLIPKHILQNTDINTATFNQKPISTGPFNLVVWKPSQYILLERNDLYFGSRAKVKKIIMKIIPDSNTQLMAYQKDEVDELQISPKDVDAVKKLPNRVLYRYEDLQYTYLGFNLKKPWFSNFLVRQAIAYAINKPALVQTVLKGYGKPADTPCAPVSWAYPSADQLVKYDYDPKKSEALLVQAGFKRNPKTQWFEKDGKVFEFTLITNKGNPEREKTAEILQQALKQVGIKMNIQVMEWSSFVKMITGPKDPKPFDAVMLGWALGTDPDSYLTWHSSQYPAGFNFVGYKNAKVDSLLVQGRREMDQKKRKAIYQEMHKLIASDLPYIFLYYPEVVISIHKRVQGLSKPGPAGLMNRIEEVHLIE